jgi:hypothetical protein
MKQSLIGIVFTTTLQEEELFCPLLTLLLRLSPALSPGRPAKLRHPAKSQTSEPWFSSPFVFFFDVQAMYGHGIQRALHLHPDYVVWQLDMANTFNFSLAT